MKWGVRRYQNKDGSLTAAGKKRYDGDGSDAKSKLSRQERKAIKKAHAEEVERQNHEANKQKAIASGNAKDVLKYKGELTQQEMQYISSRIRWEQEMQSISAKERDAGKAKVDKMFATVDDVTKYASSAAKAYNMAANLYNAFNKDKKLLPKIDLDTSKGNRNERKAEAKERKKAEEAAKKRAEQEAQKEPKRKERAEKRAKTEEDTKHNTKSDTEKYTYTVYDNPSKSKANTKSEKRSTDDPIEASWRWVDESATSVPAETRALGQRYIAGLLEEPKKKK